MSVWTEHTVVMWMLSVTIPWDLNSARVKMDFKEMELNAQVTSSDIFTLRLLFSVFQISERNGLIYIIFLFVF